MLAGITRLTGNLLRRLDIVGRVALLALVIAIAVFVPATALTVQYTAQSQFCNSCHIMEPYYESWESSSHANVACIECHYTPGALETVEGKFQALSQLAKYVTRTQGTKPWAEVSDQSCMRSGCHSVRMLEGPIAFGNVKFDHEQHLLETRRGRRLRCTSCHSQIVQGDHVSVTESVCITCHFMPVDGKIPEATSECSTCHDSPSEAIDVAGEAFVHAEYVDRGVSCRECHDPVLKGDGVVRRDRCRSCHGEIEFLERFDDTVFLHEMHITEHKIECFECHDELQHGLMPLESPTLESKDGCSSCHVSSHDAAGLLLTGTGAIGVDGEPSRMFETRVVCTACHSGRAGPRTESSPHSGGAHGGMRAPGVARAGAVDCIHCHGPGVAGMLESWQATVGGQLDGLRPRLAAVEEQLAQADAETLALFERARTNVQLIEMDGSRGAHNVNYAVDVLDAAAQDLADAEARLDSEAGAPAPWSTPFRSESGCTDCHIGLEHTATIELGRTSFSHRAHLEDVGLDCAACHSTIEHGEPNHGVPSFPRSSCAQCHHAEPDEGEFDPWDCASCHEHQVAYVAGELEGFAELPGPMAEKDCESCHGEPPDVMSPNVALCALCHDEEYSAMPAAWRASTNEAVRKLEAALADARSRGVDAAAIDGAERALEAVESDGSSGAHNTDLSARILKDALEALE